MSALSTRAGEYLALRRSLGFTLRAEGRLLRSFVDAQRLGVVRGFARHLQAIDDCCEVPPPELLAFPKRRAQLYLYSQAEIASLMDAARARAGASRRNLRDGHRATCHDRHARG